jgi:hypothetical protein
MPLVIVLFAAHSAVRQCVDRGEKQKETYIMGIPGSCDIRLTITSIDLVMLAQLRKSCQPLVRESRLGDFGCMSLRRGIGVAQQACPIGPLE